MARDLHSVNHLQNLTSEKESSPTAPRLIPIDKKNENGCNPGSSIPVVTRDNQRNQQIASMILDAYLKKTMGNKQSPGGRFHRFSGLTRVN